MKVPEPSHQVPRGRFRSYRGLPWVDPRVVFPANKPLSVSEGRNLSYAPGRPLGCPFLTEASESPWGDWASAYSVGEDELRLGRRHHARGTASVPLPWVDPWVETPVFMPFLTRSRLIPFRARSRARLRVSLDLVGVPRGGTGPGYTVGKRERAGRRHHARRGSSVPFRGSIRGSKRLCSCRFSPNHADSLFRARTPARLPSARAFGLPPGLEGMNGSVASGGLVIREDRGGPWQVLSRAQGSAPLASAYRDVRLAPQREGESPW
jgi:hypothetical protein